MAMTSVRVSDGPSPGATTYKIMDAVNTAPRTHTPKPPSTRKLITVIDQGLVSNMRIRVNQCDGVWGSAG